MANIYLVKLDKEVPGNGKSAKCKLCKTSIQLSNMGESALILHTRGDKHKKIADLKEVQTFFLPEDHLANQHQRHCHKHLP